MSFSSCPKVIFFMRNLKNCIKSKIIGARLKNNFEKVTKYYQYDILWPKQNFIFSSVLFWWPPASSCLQLEKFGEMITLHNKRSNNVNKHHTVSDIMYIMKIMQTFTTTRANTILDYSNPHIWINKFARCQIFFSIEFFKVKAYFFFIFGQFFCLAYLMIFKVENER